MTAPSYKIHTAREAQKEPPPVKWVVEDIIGEESLAVFYGEAGSKKTYSLFDMGICIASGKDWLGHHSKQQKVLIVDQESGDLRVWRRLNWIMRGHKIDKDIPLSYVCMPCFNLMRAADTGHLKILIQKEKARVILIDALADVMPGGDDSSSKDTGIVFENLKELVHSLRVVIVVIHHTNRKGAYRGSSNIKAQVDLMVEIESKVKSNEIAFEATKLRDSESLEFSAIAHFLKDSFYLSPKDHDKSGTAITQYILDSFAESNCSLLDLQSNAPDGMTRSAIKTTLYKLIEDKKAKRMNPGTRGVDAVYGSTNGRTKTELLFLK